MTRFYIYIILNFIVIQCCGQDTIDYPVDSNLCIHGKVYTYYSNGAMKAYNTYEHGFLYGPYEKYYKNGQLKEKGFLDNVNQRTLLFQPYKVVKENYDRNGRFKKSITEEILPVKPVPSGKCMCSDGNVKRIRSLLTGIWEKDTITTFNKNNELIDSVYNNYETQIEFFQNDSFTICRNGKKQNGRYILTSNTLQLEIQKSEVEWEYLISMRWPVKTLYPNSSRKHFNFQLIEVLNVLNSEKVVVPSNVIVKFKRKYIGE